MEVIRPAALDGILSCDREKVDTSNPIRLGIMTTIHAWGNEIELTSSRQDSRSSC